MAASDYLLMDYVSELAVTLEVLNASGGSDTVKTYFGFITGLSIRNGGQLAPLIYFKKMSVFSAPVRMLTHVPRFTSGALQLSGMFTSEDNVADCFDDLNSDYLQQITLTFTEDDSTEHKLYCRHCLLNTLGLRSSWTKGLNMVSGNLGIACGHIINSSHPYYSSSTYDLRLTY